MAKAAAALGTQATAAYQAKPREKRAARFGSVWVGGFGAGARLFWAGLKEGRRKTKRTTTNFGGCPENIQTHIPRLFSNGSKGLDCGGLCRCWSSERILTRTHFQLG